MAAPRRPGTRRRSAPAPVRDKYTWHILTATGADATVTAHECDHYDGVLTFRNHVVIDGDKESVLVRAFGPGHWVEASRVDVSDVVSQP